MNTSRTSLKKAAGLAVAVLASLGVFALYLQPEFMVTLAGQIWACF
ncbi:MAG: hypothetical protein ACKO1L_10785 [Brachymonas sp.]